MISWRFLLATPPEIQLPTQYPQNPQNEVGGGSFEDIEDIEQGIEPEWAAPAAPRSIQASEGPPLPAAPLQPGWRVAYMDHLWRLAGGHDDPDRGTVQACRWEAGAWSVTLTDGQTIPLSRVRSVGAVDHKGRLMGAWTVREHGFDGSRSQCPDERKLRD